MPSSTQRAVVAPVGGFGNHLRWLMMLSLPDAGVSVDFIMREVYPAERTWHNWLAYEHRFRAWDRLNAAISFSHSMQDIAPDTKCLLLTCPPDLCLRSYVKLNSSLNSFTMRSFMIDIDEVNAANQSMATVHGDTTVLDSSVLYAAALDRTMYAAATTALQLPYHYADAQEIHDRWYQLHLRCEGDMLRDLEDIFSGRFDFYAHGRQRLIRDLPA